MSSYRIDLEPWIPAVGEDGVEREYSLVEVFEEAGQIQRLTGTPAEVVSIFRFLLAICHLTETPKSLKAWGELWAEQGAFMQRCANYVRKHEGAWDLFDSKTPFGQDPSLMTSAASKKKAKPAHLLLYDAAQENNPLLLDHHHKETCRELSGAGVIRGLLTANALSGSSGGGYEMGLLAARSVGILDGGILSASLLLNLVVEPAKQPDFEWSQYGRCGPQDWGRGKVHLLLWWSRRFRVVPSDDKPATRSIFRGPGLSPPWKDKLPLGVEPIRDHMTFHRRDSKTREPKAVHLSPARALWRSAHVLLGTREQDLPLSALEQLIRLARRSESDFRSHDVSLRCISLSGNAKGPVYDAVRDDMLPFGLSVLDDDKCLARLQRSVGNAEKVAGETQSKLDEFCEWYLFGKRVPVRDKDRKMQARCLCKEISENLRDFWQEVAPLGERIACDDFDEDAWAEALHMAATAARRRAIDRLPADARRFRAEYAAKSVKGDAA